MIALLGVSAVEQPSVVVGELSVEFSTVQNNGGYRRVGPGCTQYSGTG